MAPGAHVPSVGGTRFRPILEVVAVSPSPHPRLRGVARLLVALCLAVLATTSLAPAAVSKSPHEVDQSTLQPALNPQFEPWSCWEAGDGIICQGSFSESYSGPIGLFCGDQEVWISGTAKERMTRWHTADGLATKTVVNLQYPADVFTLGPDGDGASLTFSGHWNRHYTYAVPGDRESRTLSERGLVYRGTSGGDRVLLDVGTVTFAPGEDFETVATLHGVHDVYSRLADDPFYIDGVICDALT
jgi:hypothetical protein